MFKKYTPQSDLEMFVNIKRFEFEQENKDLYLPKDYRIAERLYLKHVIREYYTRTIKR